MAKNAILISEAGIRAAALKIVVENMVVFLLKFHENFAHAYISQNGVGRHTVIHCVEK